MSAEVVAELEALVKDLKTQIVGSASVSGTTPTRDRTIVEVIRLIEARIIRATQTG